MSYMDTNVTRVNTYLEGRDFICRERVREVYRHEFVPVSVKYGCMYTTRNEDRKRVLSSSTELISKAPLNVVFEDDIAKMRKMGLPLFILKEKGRFYCALLNEDDEIHSIKGINTSKCSGHKCADCPRMTAAPDELGGCKKVREKGIGIEDCDWISCGYETVNVLHEVFVVLKCDNCRGKYKQWRTDSTANMIIALS